MDEVIVKSKKLTATTVMKSYNLTPEELDTLLGQIFEALEDEMKIKKISTLTNRAFVQHERSQVTFKVHHNALYRQKIQSILHNYMTVHTTHHSHWS